MSAFEVRCPSCRVTFPVGTRRCLHCGGRTGPAPARVSEADALGISGREAEIVGEAGVAQEAEEVLRQSPLRVISSLSWVLVVLALSLYRYCSG